MFYDLAEIYGGETSIAVDFRKLNANPFNLEVGHRLFCQVRTSNKNGKSRFSQDSYGATIIAPCSIGL